MTPNKPKHKFQALSTLAEGNDDTKLPNLPSTLTKTTTKLFVAFNVLLFVINVGTIVYLLLARPRLDWPQVHNTTINCTSKLVLSQLSNCNQTIAILTERLNSASLLIEQNEQVVSRLQNDSLSLRQQLKQNEQQITQTQHRAQQLQQQLDLVRRQEEAEAQELVPMVRRDDTCACRQAIHNVSWVQNILVWNQPVQHECGFRQLSAAEVKDVFVDECVYLVGDSVTRQLAVSLGVMLRDGDRWAEFLDSDPGIHEDLDIITLLAISPNTTRCLTFIWAACFPEIHHTFTTTSPPLSATSMVISFGAWFSKCLLVDNKLVKYDILAMMRELCAMPGNTRFIIRTPTASINPDDNSNIDQIRLLMLELIFPASNTVCCGNHSIVLFDTYNIMRDRSYYGRQPAEDNGIYHFTATLRVSMAEAVVNLMAHLAKSNANGGDACCVPAQTTLPVSNSSIQALISERPRDCVISRLQTIDCAVKRRIEENDFSLQLGQLIKEGHVHTPYEYRDELPSLFFFFPISLASDPPPSPHAHSSDKIWMLVKGISELPYPATDNNHYAFSWFVNDVHVSKEEVSMEKWTWLELSSLMRKYKQDEHYTGDDAGGGGGGGSGGEKGVWWWEEVTSSLRGEGVFGCGSEFDVFGGCRVVKLIPRSPASVIAAVYVGTDNPEESDFISQAVDHMLTTTSFFN